MRNQLEKLEEKKLIEIAIELNIYKPENLSREELVNNILRVSGHKISEAPKQIKIKRTSNNIKINIIFSCMIIITFSSVLVPFINRFIFPHFAFSSSGHFIYITILNVFSLLWSIYIWKIWIRSGHLNPFMIISILMSLAYDGYYLWSMYDYIKVLHAYKLFPDYMDLYHKAMISFCVWTSILSSSLIIGVASYLTLRNK